MCIDRQVALVFTLGCAIAVLVAACGGDNAGKSGAAGGAVVDDAVAAGDAEAASDASATADITADGIAADASDPFVGAPARICNGDGGWDGKSALFVEATAAFGLAGEDRPRGLRLSAADLDGDLYPDVIVRRNVIGARSTPSDVALRHFTALMNVAQADGRQLVDKTVASGLLATRDGGVGRPCHVVVFGDIDNDGDVDVFCGMNVTQANLGEAIDTSEWLRNKGDGSFELVAEASPFGGVLRRSLTSATLVDHNRDGALDLWLGFNAWGNAATADLLLAGDGKGGFVDVSGAEGLGTLTPTLANLQSGAAHRDTWGTGACDFNGDGNPDLYTTSYGRYFNGLWMGGGLRDGARYSDEMHTSQFDRDLDDDWTSNWNAQCYCAENPKAADCDTTPKPLVNCASLKAAFGGKFRWNHATDRDPWRLGGTTAGAVCADLDRDGDLDAVQWGIVHSDVGASSDPSQVLINKGGAIPLFDHPAPKVSGLMHVWEGLSWNEGDMSGAVGDIDLDGRLDIVLAGSDYPGTRATVYLQQPDGTFKEVPFANSIDQPRAAGLVLVDLDRDGDLDVVLGSSRARCSGESGKDCPADEAVRVWRNNTISAGNSGGNWVEIALDGGVGAAADDATNRSAIGARVEVVTGTVTQTLELQGGYGHFGQQNDLVLHVGLGAACDIDEVRVRWPNAAAQVQTFKHVRANAVVKLKRGEAQVSYPLFAKR